MARIIARNVFVCEGDYVSGGRIAVIVILLVVATAFIALFAVLRNRRYNLGTGAEPAVTPRREAQPQYVPPPPQHVLPPPASLSVGDIAVGVMFGMWLFAITAGAIALAVAVLIREGINHG
jgi:hypothetical protein